MATQLHPLTPLAVEEYEQITAILKRDQQLDGRARFTSILLREPDKATILAAEAGTPTAREADVVVLDRTSGNTFTGVVSLTEDRVTEWVHRIGEHANFTEEELLEVDEAMRAEPRVIEALAARGITNMEDVSIEVWGYPGNLIPERYRGMRIGWTDVWVRAHPKGNIYANPVSGLCFLVDLHTMTLLEIEDRYELEPNAEAMGEYHPDVIPTLVPGFTLRDDIKPLEISQPEGHSFTVEGTQLKWQNWSMRLGFNSREGATIHQLAYEDGDKGVRSIAHRFSFAEMVVPYRDPTPDHNRRTAFDIGEWGLGFMTTSLELGCDCLGDIQYLDAVIHDWEGRPVVIKNAICIHEEDDAVLWKHVDPNTGTEVRRSRRLVVSFHATVANYEYLVYWRFYQDGNIECEVRATGIMVTTQFAPGQAPSTGTVIDVERYAPYHQHFLIARLDMDVDGTENTVYQVDSVAPEIGPGNEYGLAMEARATRLTTESEGIQDANWPTARAWKIVNENKKNRYGTNTAYKLYAEGAFPHVMHPESAVFDRAAVLRHTLWVTPNSTEEKWPCGDLVTQTTTDTGLPAWTAQNRSIENTDVVLWYVLGIHHITRPEEWPMMAVDKVSMWLKPMGFFDRNPALDVPPAPRQHGESGHCHT